MGEPAGYLSLVLHAHLPYVRHPEHESFLEELWLFEAILETYLPLIQVFDALEKEGVDYHVLLSMSPTLVTMLEDELLQERFSCHLWNLYRLTEKEVNLHGDPHLKYLSAWYRDRIQDSIHWFEEVCQRRLAQYFAKIASNGHLELMTCAATHGFLPLLKSDPGAVRAQVLTASGFHEDVFGVKPAGIWLPECAYYPGVEDVLREAEIRFFFVDTHSFEHASSRSRWGVYAPLYCPGGVAAFARDPESGKQVWSAEEGFPGHPDYREFYRDIGFERDENYIHDFLVDGHIRTHTGIKYCRITGGDHKEYYHPEAARERAAIHAQTFLDCRRDQVRRLSSHMERSPLIVSPYDAELFGHWWYEGPVFLDMLLRKMHYDQDEVKTITPSIYLQKYPTNPMAVPGGSSWGGDGYYEFWCTDSNSWVYPHLHSAADRMAAAAKSFSDLKDSDPRFRVLRQMGRELLLAQGSDWSFIMRTGTSPDYASRRVRDHLGRFSALCDMLEHGEIDEDRLAALEEIDKLFPNLNPRTFLPA